MLSQEVEERLANYLVARIEETNAYILRKIGNNIKLLSTLSPSEARQLGQILKYGGSYEEITRELARVSGKNVEDIYKIFDEVARSNKEFAKQFYEYRGMDFIPYTQDIALQRQVRSIGNITANLYRNISNTSIIGYVLKDNNGNKIFRNIQDTYQEVIDRAILSVGQGKESFNTTMRNTIKELGGSGLVQYESGRTRRLDSAVRMNILDGIRQVNMETSRRFGEEYGADGIEISVHSAPAPDHADIQGRQFRKAEYAKLEAGLTAIDVNGNSYSGLGRRHIATHNCYHVEFNIVVGVSKPLYTDEQLEEIEQKNEEGFEFEGKHYTMYEGTQLQRQIELAVRKQKDTQILARASGDDFRDIAETSQKKINQLTNKYSELCQISGLRFKRDRMTVSGYRKIKVA